MSLLTGILLSIVYFFFNRAFLPHGVLWTTLISPLLCVWLLREDKKKILYNFSLIACPIILMQTLFGASIDAPIYWLSVSNFILVIVTAIAFANFLVRYGEKSAIKIFTILIVINFVFSQLALLAFQFGQLNELWSFELRPRLQLLTYEPSYYGTLMIPLLTYSIYRAYTQPNFGNLLMLCFSLLPFYYCSSVGASISLLSGLLVVLILNIKNFGIGKSIVACLIFAIVSLVINYSSDDYIINRFLAFLSNEDSSGAVRVNQSFQVAYSIAESTSLIFGAGFGQSKILAPHFFDEWWPGLNFADIGNVVAGTLAELGIFGLFVRFFLEFYLYFKTRVSVDLFRATIFWTVFVYQFTGSFLSNLAEYILWVFAFVPVFSFLDSSKSSSRFKSKARIVFNIKRNSAA